MIGMKYDKEGKVIYELNNVNGKGKVYDNNNNNLLIFEGEYLNGKRNGKRKKYYIGGNLLFEGAYINDKRNGKGK